MFSGCDDITRFSGQLHPQSETATLSEREREDLFFLPLTPTLNSGHPNREAPVAATVSLHCPLFRVRTKITVSSGEFGQHTGERAHQRWRIASNNLAEFCLSRIHCLRHLTHQKHGGLFSLHPQVVPLRRADRVRVRIEASHYHDSERL